MNEWLNIMLEEIDRKEREAEADRQENEKREEEQTSGTGPDDAEKATRNSA